MAPGYVVKCKYHFCVTIPLRLVAGGQPVPESRRRSTLVAFAVAIAVAMSAWALTAAPAAAAGPVTVAVDPNLDRRAINPLIYGVNWAGTAELATGLYTANRR